LPAGQAPVQAKLQASHWHVRVLRSLHPHPHASICTIRAPPPGPHQLPSQPLHAICIQALVLERKAGAVLGAAGRLALCPLLPDVSLRCLLCRCLSQGLIWQVDPHTINTVLALCLLQLLSSSGLGCLSEACGPQTTALLLLGFGLLLLEGFVLATAPPLDLAAHPSQLLLCY
jgi:hypothetical protein